MKLRLHRHHLPAILLLVTASLLLLKIGTDLARDHHSSLPPSLQQAPGSPDLTLALQQEFSLPPMEKSYDAMVTRPLFTPGRRPATSLSSSALPSTMRKGQFILLGVIITEGKKIAMLREIATRKVVNIEQGNEINGIRLAGLAPEKVTLTQGEEQEELALKIQPVAAPQQVAPQPPAENAVDAVQADAVAPGPAPAPVGSAPNARRLLPNAIQELINRRRAQHGLPVK